LKHWEAGCGTPVSLPLTLDQQPLCVDPIPSGGGIINGCEKLAFDSNNRPIISYHKLDENGHMQIYVARLQEGVWQRHAITAWDKSVHFEGRGAMPFIGISLTQLEQLEPDRFYIKYQHRDYGAGHIVLDETTLRPVECDVALPSAYPSELTKPKIGWQGIGVRLASDSGDVAAPGTKYVLRWETLPAHQDRPRDPPLPPASMLQLITLVRAE
jgi:hypothetical protein